MPIDQHSPAHLGLRELSVAEAELIVNSCDLTGNRHTLSMEAHVLLNRLDPDQLNSIIPSIRTSLDIDLSKIHSGDGFYYALRLLRAVLAHQVTLDSQFFELFNLASCYSNPHVQWGNQLNSQIVNNLFIKDERLRERAQSLMPQFIAESFRPNLLKLSAPPPKPKSGGGLLQNGQIPRLGSAGAKRDIQDENARKDWRQSPRIKVLSMARLGLVLMDKNEWQDSFGMLLISLILNVGDDYVSAMKTQACYLLQLLLERLQDSSHPSNLLSRLGLHALLLDFCKTCAHQIPSVTPISDSLELLAIAYPCMFQLVSLTEKNTVLEFTEIINSNILSSISHLSHLSPRTSPDTSNYRVICLLIDQLSALIKHYLRLGVLVSLTRIIFTLNQIIINPFIVEDPKCGQDLILRCLQCQRTILDIFNDASDEEAAILITNYRYDLIGSWIVISRRIDQVATENVAGFKENLGECKLALEENLRRCDRLNDFEQELADTPEISDPYANI